MSLQVGDEVTPKRVIGGEVLSHQLGVKLLIKDIYDDGYCTVERPDGTGCVVGVPTKLLKKLKLTHIFLSKKRR
ncbi:MAG: hypothetical protein Q8Q23_00630 [bacterium]|nr:hypothetical protein [bacterium]